MIQTKRERERKREIELEKMKTLEERKTEKQKLIRNMYLEEIKDK